jgi:hypothetical protein
MTNTQLPEWPFPKAPLNSGVVDGVLWATAAAPIEPAVNGYAYLPENHPWRGLDYGDIPAVAHGGLTYGHKNWIGFDFLHSGDYWPGQRRERWGGDEVRTTEEVELEAQNLARQVAAYINKGTYEI